MVDKGELNSCNMEKQKSDLVRGLVFLGEKKYLILILLILGMVGSFVFSYYRPTYYVATTLILPPQQSNSSVAAVTQLSSLAGFSSGLKATDEMYIAMFKSRAVTKSLAKTENLTEHYSVPSIENARLKLLNSTAIVSDRKSGLLTLSVKDESRDVAANLANGYLREMRKLLTAIAITEAQQKRMFLEGQVARAKISALEAEKKLKKLQSEMGVRITDLDVESDVKSSIEIRRDIDAKQIQLDSIQGLFSDGNIAIVRLKAELAALKKQLHKNERGLSSDAPVSSLALDAYRDLKAKNASLETMLRQLEVAKIDEAREGAVFQQIDMATPEDAILKPSKKNSLILGGAATLLLAALILILVFLRDRWKLAKSNGQLDSLSKSWALSVKS